MDELANMPPAPAPAPSSALSYSTGGGTRQRIITSCLTCRRRKVKCDHKYPICSACSRGNHTCYYANLPNQLGRAPSTGSSSTHRVTKHSTGHGRGQSSHAEINARLERLESLLERAVQQPASASNTQQQAGRRETPKADGVDHKERATSSASPKSNSSDLLAADGYDGTLLVENGQSHFVSSLHWALLTDELQDIKAILSNERATEDVAYGRVPTSSSLLFGSGQGATDPLTFMPDSQAECYDLFGIFNQNVDPVTRLVHTPTLTKRFQLFVQRWDNLASPSGYSDASPNEFYDEEQMQSFEPLAFGIFYSAINSLRPEVVMSRFRKDKQSLMRKYQRGLELALEQADFLTTSSVEVLQAFVLLLTCQAREDDMSQVWPLTGVAIRVAMLQGLHREPSLFPTSMDEVQVEIRRRIWHQICHMDWRASEGKGMEPTISDDDFTTLLPRNVNDSDLVEGRLPSPGAQFVEEEGFTDMTLQLCRLGMIKCFRKIAQSTYRLDRRIKASKLREGEQIDTIGELQRLFAETKRMIDEAHAKSAQCYLRHCRLDIPIQRLTIGLTANLEWRCWLIFWCGVPKELRQIVIADDVRAMIFTRSISLIESLNTISSDKEAEHFQWHIGGHAAFQAIMHVLSELRDSEFIAASDPQLRSRALRALHTVYRVKGRGDSNTWAVIRRMLERLDPNHECAKTHGMGGFSEKRFGEHDLSAEFFAKSPSPPPYAQMPRQYQSSPPLPQQPLQEQPLQSQQQQQPMPVNVSMEGPPNPQAYADAFLATTCAPLPEPYAGGLDGRYPTQGSGLDAGLSDLERANVGVGGTDASFALHDMAIDMDWGFWNFDPLQFDAGFGQYAGQGR